MKNPFHFLTLFLLLGLLACSDAELESERLSSLSPILFDGSSNKSVTSAKPDSLQINASCDKTTSNIWVSESASGPFSSLSSFAGVDLSSLVESCRQNSSINLDVLKFSLVSFEKGEKNQKTLFFRASSGEEKSSVSQLDISYLPPIEPKAPKGMDLSVAAGTVSSANAKIRYKVGRPIRSISTGTVFKIQRTTQ